MDEERKDWAPAIGEVITFPVASPNLTPVAHRDEALAASLGEQMRIAAIVNDRDGQPLSLRCVVMHGIWHAPGSPVDLAYLSRHWIAEHCRITEHSMEATELTEQVARDIGEPWRNFQTVCTRCSTMYRLGQLVPERQSPYRELTCPKCLAHWFYPTTTEGTPAPAGLPE